MAYSVMVDAGHCCAGVVLDLPRHREAWKMRAVPRKLAGELRQTAGTGQRQLTCISAMQSSTQRRLADAKANDAAAYTLLCASGHCTVPASTTSQRQPRRSHYHGIISRQSETSTCNYVEIQREIIMFLCVCQSSLFGMMCNKSDISPQERRQIQRNNINPENQSFIRHVSLVRNGCG